MFYYNILINRILKIYGFYIIIQILNFNPSLFFNYRAAFSNKFRNFISFKKKIKKSIQSYKRFPMIK